MARFLFRLPDIGEGVAEAEIVAWHVSVGDAVLEDQALVDVMTDKATVDITSPHRGVVLAVHGEAGSMMPVGAVLCELDLGSGVATANSAPPDAPAVPSPPPAVPSRAAPPVPAPGAAPGGRRAGGGDPLAAPATRARARSLGVDLAEVEGSGPDGRVLPADLEAYGARRTAGAADEDGVLAVKVIGLRRRIADQMAEANRRIPHITYVEECDLTELEALRASLNREADGGRTRLTLLPFFMRALVRVLPAFPSVNARYDDEAGVLRRYRGIHVGIAAQTPEGLMVPVVRHAETLGLFEGATEIARLAHGAREGRLARDELAGATITLTSLGALGGLATTPVINHPEVAVIAPNRMIARPVMRDGQVAVRMMMNISSSFDHRIVDGFEAASFIQALIRQLQSPARLLLP